MTDNNVSLQDTIPQLTKAEILALPSPTLGDVALATDTNLLGYYTGTAWVWSTTEGILSGDNTGDNAQNDLYDGIVSNATHTGDVTGATELTITNKVTMTGTSPISISGSPTVIASSAVAISIPAATTTVDGYMSSEDKSKLDDLPEGPIMANPLITAGDILYLPDSWRTNTILIPAVSDVLTIGNCTTETVVADCIIDLIPGDNLVGGTVITVNAYLWWSASDAYANWDYINARLRIRRGNNTSGSVIGITDWQHIQAPRGYGGHDLQFVISNVVDSAPTDGQYVLTLEADTGYRIHSNERSISINYKTASDIQPDRLPVGSTGQVLTVSNGLPAWSTPVNAVTSISATAPIASTGGATPTISISAATQSAAGSMSSTDKTKLDGISGTNTGDNPGVTTVSGTSPIVSSGGTTPAISLEASTVTAGSYNAANITVNSYGLVTAASDGSAVTNISTHTEILQDELGVFLTSETNELFYVEVEN